MTCGRKLGPFDCCSVVQGDCLELMRAIPEGVIDAVITDPPYNVGKDYGEADDNLPPEQYAALMGAVVGEARRIAGKQAWIPARYKSALWWSLLPDAHEVVIPMRAGNAIRGGWSSKFSVVLACGKPGTFEDDLWEGIRHRGEGYFFREETYGHPGYTPQAIMQRAIAALTAAGETVLDPYAGTGTTLVAAAQAGRHFLGFELGSQWCAIARERIALVEATPTLFAAQAEQLSLTSTEIREERP